MLSLCLIELVVCLLHLCSEKNETCSVYALLSLAITMTIASYRIKAEEDGEERECVED